MPTGPDLEGLSSDAVTIDRRFYVHESSFALLCRHYPDVADGTVRALVLSSASRLAWHHLVLNGEELGLVEPGVLGRRARRLGDAATGSLTSVFRGLVHVPAEDPRHDSVLPLLSADEVVHATCSEAGYFTFATGPESAAVMFAETGSLRALRSESRRRPADHPGLTLVSGRRLHPYVPELGHGSATRARYDSRAASSPGGPVVLGFDPVAAALDAMGDEPVLDPVADDLLSLYRRALERPVRRLVARLLGLGSSPDDATGAEVRSPAPLVTT